MIDLDTLVKSAYDLAPLPASTMRLLRVLSDQDWKLDDIIDAASLDGPLTARILSVANSPGMGSGTPVGTLSDAVMRMGAGAVLRLATGAAVRSCMATERDNQAENSLWCHSVATALSTELICLVSNVAIPAEAYSVGILHDIGRVVLSRHLDPETTELINRAVWEGENDPLDAERELLGADHCELGALITQYWGLPSLIVESIRCHHRPTESSDPAVRVIADAVTIGDAVARTVGVCGEETDKPFDYHASCERLGVSEEGFTELRELLSERVEQAFSQYE